MIQRLVITDQQQRKLEEARHDHQGIADVPRQTEEHFQPEPHWQRRMPDTWIQLDTDLHHALGPTPLLGLKGIDFNWYFRGCFFIEQIDEFPTHQLRAEA